VESAVIPRRSPQPKVGDKIADPWWESDGRILEVRPYDGRYKDYFTWIVKVTAFNTKRGWLEIAIL
jgi:hypothetical protein